MRYVSVSHALAKKLCRHVEVFFKNVEHRSRLTPEEYLLTFHSTVPHILPYSAKYDMNWEAHFSHLVFFVQEKDRSTLLEALVA